MLIVSILAGVLGYQADAQMQQIDYMRMAYRANKEAFRFGTFEFEYLIGVSGSSSDAAVGAFKQSIKESGFYVFDGKNGRYELVANPKDVRNVTKWLDERKRKSTSLASTFRVLTDGKVTLMDLLYLNQDGGPDLRHRAQIFPGTTLYFSNLDFPLFIGDYGDRPYDLFSALTAIKDGRASLVEVDPDSQLDGMPACKVTFTYEEGRCTYWIDLNRGAVPLRIQDHYNPSGTDVLFVFSELVQTPGAGWLPRRMLHIIGEGVAVYQLHITKLDARNRPPSSTFQLEFPEPIGLGDKARNLAYSPRKVWSLLDLPSRSSREARPAIPKSFITPAELPGEIGASYPWATLISLTILLLVSCGLALIFWRWRKPS